MSQSTAGKGPGIVLRAENHSGAVRLTRSKSSGKAILELMESDQSHCEVGLGVQELRMLSRALHKLADALTAEQMLDEVTHT